MRSVSQRWGAHAAAAVRERRFYIKIEPNPGTAADDLYLPSNGDITIGASGTVLDARIISARVSSQRLNPDQGRATIGSMSFDVLDVAGSFTTAIRTELLTDSRGLRGKRVSVYNGFTDLDYDEYELEDTQVVVSARYRSGGKWSIQCRDIQREMRKTIFEPVVMHLTAPLSETATTIEVDSAASLTAVEHGTSYSDGASSTVAYVKIDDEIIRVPTAGIGATQLTSCVRGRLGTRAAEHTTDETAGSLRGKEVSEVIYLELPVPKLAYALLTGVLLNQSGTLPSHWHLGIDASDFVTTSEFQNIGDDLYVFADDTEGMIERYILTGTEDGKRFIEKEILRKYGLFMPVHVNGELGLRRGQPVLSGSATLGEINDRFLIGDVEVRFDMTKIINDIEIGWNFIGDNPARRLRIEDTDSITKWGRAPLLEVQARGLAGSIHTDSRVRDLYESLRDRYSGPPILANLTVQASLSLFEVGDVVRVRTTHVKDFTNTVTDTLDRAFEIQGVTKDLMTGRIKYEVFGSSQRAGPLAPLESTTPLPDSYYTAAGTDISGLAGVVDGGSELTLPDGLSLSGNADVTNTGAIYYATKNVRIPSGNTVSYTQNVQLRIRGTFTIEGDLEGVGAGLTGVADTYDVNNFPPGFGPTESYALPALQGGQIGYFGSTQADGGIFDRVSQRSGSSTRYRARIQSIPAPVTQGAVESIPSLNLNWDDTTLSGLPTDLRGTSGGPGGIRYWEDYNDAAIDTNRGGTGGAGGAGLLIICRGMSFGASGRIDSSGDDGIVGVRNAGDERPAWSGGGAGGAPGATIIVLDGAAVSTPVLTNGSIVADYGATPKPGGDYNQLTSALVINYNTRFNEPSVDNAFIREDRFSFYESAASGREAGIAAARYFFLLPNVTAEEDTDDVALADTQDISLAIVESFGNRLDPLLTNLLATITENTTTQAYSHANIYVRGSSANAEYADWYLLGGAEPSLQFDLPADGETYDIRAVPVLTNGVEASSGQTESEVITNGDGTQPVIVMDQIGGSVIANGTFLAAVPAAEGGGNLRPMFWYRRDVSTLDGAAHSYADLARSAFVLDGTVAHTAILISEAFRVNPESQYEVVFAAAQTAGSADLGVRINTKDSALSAGKRALSYIATGSSDLEVDTGATNFQSEAINTTGSQVEYSFTYVPDPAHRWASISFLTGDGSSTYELTYCFIREKSVSAENVVSQQPLSGLNVQNPNFSIRMPGAPDRPAGWWIVNSASTTALRYQTGTSDVAEFAGNFAIVGTGFRTDATKRYRVTVVAKGSQAMLAALDIQISELNSELDIAGGEYTMSDNGAREAPGPAYDAIQFPTSNQDLTTSFQAFTAEWTPGASAVWSAVRIYGSAVAGDVLIDSVTIEDLTPVTVSAEPPGLTWSTYEAGGWSPADTTRSVTVLFHRGNEEVASRLLNAVLDDSGANEGDIGVTASTETGDDSTVSVANNDSASVTARVTHDISGVSILVPFGSELPGYSGGPGK